MCYGPKITNIFTVMLSFSFIMTQKSVLYDTGVVVFRHRCRIYTLFRDKQVKKVSTTPVS